jgi:hypothetical protein
MADRIDRALDAALGMTFPARDPIALRTPEARVAPDASEPRAGRAGASTDPRADLAHGRIGPLQ